MPRTARLLTPVTLAALLLAGCTPSTPMPAPPPTPDATPVFASDEEALAAAEEAYRTYVATVDAILQDGGANAERLRDLASEELLTVQREGFDAFAANGWRSEGNTELRNFVLQQYRERNVVLYVCADVSAVDVVDSEGNSKVSPDRPPESTHEVSLHWDDKFIIVSDEPWSGDGVC